MQVISIAKQQLSLRFGQGGFGLTQSSSMAAPAYLGAWASSLFYLSQRQSRLAELHDQILQQHDCSSHDKNIHCHLENALLELHQTCESTKQIIDASQNMPDLPKKLQSKLSSKIKDQAFKNFLDECSNSNDKARVISCGGSIADGCWLDAIPSLQAYIL